MVALPLHVIEEDLSGALAKLADQIHERHSVLAGYFDELAGAQSQDRMSQIHAVVVRDGRVERQLLQTVAMVFGRDAQIQLADGADSVQQSGCAPLSIGSNRTLEIFPDFYKFFTFPITLEASLRQASLTSEPTSSINS